MITEKDVEITQGHETLQLSAIISGIRISKRYSDYSTGEALQDFLADVNHFAFFGTQRKASALCRTLT
tara:strand:+ start:501 stop:704 length:204 start_codon:yes stop_codon:yes gene_type:complete